jgi:hypothetical protein
MDLQKILKIVLAALGLLSIVLLVNIISNGDDAIKAGENASTVSTYMYLAYFVLFLAFLAVTLFGYKSLIIRLIVAIALLIYVIVSLIKPSLFWSLLLLVIPVAKFVDLILDFPNSKSMLIGVSSFTLLAIVCYFVFASGVETMLRDGTMLSVSQSKLVGAGLYLFYALAFVAGGTMLFFGVKKSLNK